MKNWDRQIFFSKKLNGTTVLSSLFWCWWARSQISTSEDLRLVFFWKTPNGVLLLPDQYCSRQILKLSMPPKVLRKLYPCTGTLHNYSDLVDLRYLNGGTTAAANLEYPIWWIWEIWMVEQLLMLIWNIRSGGSERSEWWNNCCCWSGISDLVDLRDLNGGTIATADLE